MKARDDFSSEVWIEEGFQTLLRQGGFLGVRSEGGQVLRGGEDDIICHPPVAEEPRLHRRGRD